MQIAELDDKFVKGLYKLNEIAKQYLENKNSENIYSVLDEISVFKDSVTELTNERMKQENIWRI